MTGYQSQRCLILSGSSGLVGSKALKSASEMSEIFTSLWLAGDPWRISLSCQSTGTSSEKTYRAQSFISLDVSEGYLNVHFDKFGSLTVGIQK